MGVTVFLLVAAIGAATSYVGDSPASGDTPSLSGPDGEMLARLTDYAHPPGGDDPASKPSAGKMMPDLNTMIDRLAARLETKPEDIEGWRMLGASYFHTERYEKAVAAYAKAVELDPNSADLKSSYEEAKAKASGSLELPSLESKAARDSDAGPSAEMVAKSEATPPRASDAEIRSMVDGLADRLENSPRDVDGWTRLMRSRVVLGENEVAATAFAKALEIFKDDAAASGKITAVAAELGLK